MPNSDECELRPSAAVEGRSPTRGHSGAPELQSKEIGDRHQRMSLLPRRPLDQTGAKTGSAGRPVPQPV